MSIAQLQAATVAGNVATDFVTPDGTQRRVLYGILKLDTDATVANRWVRLAILDLAGNTIICMCAGLSVPASQSDQLFSYMQGVYRETTALNKVLQVPIAFGCVVPPGYTIRAYIENGVAGDAYDIDLMVEDGHLGAPV